MCRRTAISCWCVSATTTRAGARVNLALLKQGVIVRPVGNYGLPQWLRITIGLPEENEAFIAALEKTLATA